MIFDVKTYARGFELLCKALIPIVFITPFILWFFGDTILESAYELKMSHFTFWQRSLLLLVHWGSSALVAYGLWTCSQIAHFFRQGEVFTAYTVALFWRLSKIAACWGIYNLAIQSAFFVFLVPHNTKLLALLVFGSLIYLFVFIFLSLLATLVARASDLQKDQDLTV